MRLPVDSELLTSDEQAYDKEDDISEIIELLLESRQKAFDKAESNIEQEQKRKRSCMTESISQMNYQRVPWYSSMVLLENTAQKQHRGKLCPAWLGPYTISKHIGKGAYEPTGVVIRKKANISRLKV